MKSSIISKASAIILMSITLACATNFYEGKRSEMGREAYLAREKEKFDKHFEKPDSITSELLGSFVIATPVFIIYEGIGWVVARALKRKGEER